MIVGPYKKLETRIFQSGIEKRELAERIGISYVSLYKRLKGETKWSLEEAYLVMQALEIPMDQLTVMFPVGLVIS
jgi:predicted transcriptional regulator